MQNKLLTNTALIFLSSIMAFFIVPIFMIGNSPSDYSFIQADIFYKTAILFSIIAGTVLSLINTLLKLLKLNKMSILYVHFMLTYIVLSGFILSVSESTGMVTPENNPVDIFNLIAVLFLSLLSSIISLTSFKKYIQIFLLVVIASSTTQAIISVYNFDNLKIKIYDQPVKTYANAKNSQTNFANHTSLQLSNKKNIFVISFDGVPGEIVTDIIKNNKKTSNDLKDFTIFENAVSQAPATIASLIGDIYGVRDYKSIGKNILEIKKKLEENGSLEKITANIISDSFQYHYDGYGIDKLRINNPINEEFNIVDSINFFKYPFIRLFTSYGLRLINWHNYALMFAERMIITPSKYEIINKLMDHKGASWDRRYILTLNLFDSFISDISVKDKKLSLRYLHIPFTHFPVDYDEKCKYRSNDRIWYDANQNEQGIKNQDICVLSKFINFIQKLKQLGIYDKSLIVFKSDHGKPVTYFSEAPNNLRINEQNMWGYNRYRPVLMIKDFESNNLEPTFKSELVLLNDIAKTICEKSSVQSDCKSFHGVNLLGKSLKSNEPYYLYVPKNAKSSFKYPTHISVKIPSREISLQTAMENSELINLSLPTKKSWGYRAWNNAIKGW